VHAMDMMRTRPRDRHGSVVRLQMFVPDDMAGTGQLGAYSHGAPAQAHTTP
jgi:hypothetical protein